MILLKIMTSTPEASGALPLHASTSCTQGGGNTAHPWSTAAPRTVQAAGCSGSQASWSECQYWYCRTAQNFSMGLGSETFPGELGASRHLQPTGKIPDEGGAGGGGAAGLGLTACRPGIAKPIAAGAGVGVVTTELTSPARQVRTQLLALFVEPAQGGHKQHHGRSQLPAAIEAAGVSAEASPGAGRPSTQAGHAQGGKWLWGADYGPSIACTLQWLMSRHQEQA